MVLGAILLGAEMFAIDAQFYLVFLGVSAALVGLAGLFGISMDLWVQWTAFAVLSLIFMFTFRKQLYMKIRGNVEGFKEIHYKPFRVIYQISNDVVFIHAVLDGRRDLHELLERRLLR